MKNRLTIVLSLILLNVLYSNAQKGYQAVVSIDNNTIISDGYIGNGAQWDPYQLYYGTEKIEISDADWQKLYDRLDFMRPQFIRVMQNTISKIENGELVAGMDFKYLSKILDYCQSRHVTVVLGDWGSGMVDLKTNKANNANIKHAADYLNFLVNDKKYTCIRYYNMINEPNGNWSATNGNYPLWASAIRQLHSEMEKINLTEKVGIVGPDAAIWNENETGWVDSCATKMGNIIQLYDIHTYPSKITVNSGEYSDIISAYKSKVPAGKKIIMGEMGFKYLKKVDSLYLKENLRRAQSKKYASTDDSQMYVYDYMYGTDIADALFQTINSGFSGSVAWMLDDAMHSQESIDKLYVWGFWNILGDEYFGAEEETVRPWFYAWSLLTKYLPAGSKIHKTNVAGDPSIKAISIEKGDKQMFAVVNVSGNRKRVKIESKTMKSLSTYKKFIYADGFLKKDGDHILLPNETGLSLDLSKGESLDMPAESLIVYTNFD